MPKLLRIAFDNVGHQDARLHGLDIATELNGKPCSTVLWLRNGGGKSSIISLLCSVFVPNLREFTSKGEGRSLEGYVGKKGIAIVATEWTAEGAPDGRRRVVGVAMARRGEDGGGLRRLFFSFTTGGNPTLFGQADDPMRDFPIRSNGKNVQSLAEFSNWLRRTEREFPGHDVYSTDSQAAWQGFLESRRFEERDFRLIASMNRKEGLENEGVLRLRNAGEFVDFVIENVHDTQAFDLLRKGILTARQNVSETNAIRARIGFSDQMLPLLHEASDADRNLAEALAARDAATGEALNAAVRVGGSLGRARRRGEAALSEGKRAAALASTSRSEALKCTVAGRALLLRVGATEVKELSEAVREAQATASAQAAVMHAAQAAQTLAAWRLTQTERDVARAARDAALLPWQDLRLRLERARSALSSSLEAGRSKLNAAATEALNEAGSRDGEVSGHASEAAGLRGLEGAALGAAKSDFEAADERDRAHRQLHETKLVGEDETVAEALTRWRFEAEACAERAEAHRLASETAVAERSFRKAEGDSAMRESASEKRKAETLLREIESYDARLFSLLAMPGMAMLGDGGVAPDVFEQGLSVRADRAIARAREDATNRRKEVAPALEMSRRIEANGGFLPLSPDAQEVVGLLQDLDLNAHLYARYLSENGQSPDEVAALLAADPARYSGVVVVGDNDFAKARAWQAPHPLASPVQITSAAASEREGAAAHHVVGIHPAAFSRPVAADLVEDARRRGEAAEIAAAADEARAVVLDGFVRVLHGFTGTYSAAWRDDKFGESEIARARSEELLMTGATALAASEAASETYRTSERLFLETRRSAADAMKSAECCAVFLTAWPDTSEVLRDRAAAHKERAARAAAEADERERLAQGARARATSARTSAREISAEAARLASEAAALGERAPWTEAVPDLVRARVEYESLSREGDAATDDSALRERVTRTEVACERAEHAYVILEKRHSLVLVEVEAWLDAPLGAVDSTAEKLAIAEEAVRAAGATLSDATADLRALGEQFGQEARRVAEAAGPAELSGEARREAAELLAQARRSAVASDSLEKLMKEAAETSAEMKGAIQTLSGVMRGLPDFAREAAVKAEAMIVPGEIELPLDADAVLTEWEEAHRRGAAVLADAEKAERRARLSVNALAKCVRDDRWRVGADAMMLRMSLSIDEGRVGEELEGAIEDVIRMGGFGRKRLAEAEAAANDLVADLDVQVQDLRSALRRLGSASTIPDDPSMGAWAKRPFVDVSLDGGDDAAERTAALRGMLVTLCEGKGDIPPAVEIANMALKCTLRREPHVTMLKPGMAMDARRHPVTEVLAASGGEKLTAAVLIYSALRRLAGRMQISRNGGSMLLLDNPIGPCNLVQLLNLQRRVAEACNVQLVFTTGLNDYESVRVFPLVVALKNEGVNASGHRLVEKDLEYPLVPIEASRVEFPDAVW